MNNPFSRLLALHMLFAFVAPSVFAESMGQPEDDGKPAFYLDVDFEGRILEVDMLTKTAEYIGSISSVQSDTIVYKGGVATPDRQFALLFFHDIHGPRYPPETPYLFSRSDGTLKKSPISFLPGGDGAIVMVNSTSIFITEPLPDSREIERTIYNATTNQKRGLFDFRISPYTFDTELLDDTYAYFVEERGSVVRKVEVESGDVDQEFDVIDLVGTDEPGVGRNVWIRALYRNLALVKRRDKETQEARLFLIDVESERIVARSESLPNFYGRFLLYADEQDNPIMTCIETVVVKSKRKATGVLRNFQTEGDSITPERDETFDPESQIVLTDESGAPVIIPRYRFDYLSMREIERQIPRKVGGAGRSSVVARGRVRDEIIEEFKNPEQEGFTSRTLTHLEIR